MLLDNGKIVAPHHVNLNTIKDSSLLGCYVMITTKQLLMF